MGQTNGIFHHFREHDALRIESVDHVLGMMTATSTYTGMRETLPIKCTVSQSTLQEGRVVQVQYGTVSAVEADLAKAKRAGMRKGDRKISGMRHLVPRITPLALSLMRWALGDERCAIELVRYGERAATTQRETRFTGLDGADVRLSLSVGCITPDETWITGRAKLSVQGVHLPERLPETLLAAIAGRPIDEIVEHDALIGGGSIIHATNNETGCYIHLAPTTIDIPDAIAAIRGQQRKAA